MKLEYDDAALEEIIDAQLWWYAHRDKAPHAFEDDLDDAIQRILKRPTVGWWVKNADADNVRRLLLARVGKHIYYEIDGDVIMILALHAARGEGLPDLAVRGKRRH